MIALPAGQHRVFRRMVEGWSDDFLWLTLPGLRRGALCRRLLRQEVEGFPPPDGVFVSAPQLLLPEDAAELCCAMEYYFRFALPPSLFCILTETPGPGGGAFRGLGAVRRPGRSAHPAADRPVKNK